MWAAPPHTFFFGVVELWGTYSAAVTPSTMFDEELSASPSEASLDESVAGGEVDALEARVENSADELEAARSHVLEADDRHVLLTLRSQGNEVVPLAHSVVLDSLL